jgi:long-chain acyl-CoA synthetase
MPGVADCAVFGVPAAVQTHDGVSLTAQQVRDFLPKKLANFKVPRVVEFRSTLPRRIRGRYSNAVFKKST